MVTGGRIADSLVETGDGVPWDLSHCRSASRARGTGLGRVAPVEGATRRVCCVQAPVGARVASPQSPILRWSK